MFGKLVGIIFHLTAFGGHRRFLCLRRLTFLGFENTNLVIGRADQLIGNTGSFIENGFSAINAVVHKNFFLTKICVTFAQFFNAVEFRFSNRLGAFGFFNRLKLRIFKFRYKRTRRHNARFPPQFFRSDEISIFIGRGKS